MACDGFDELKTRNSIEIYIDRETLFEWLYLVYELSGIDQIEPAIRSAKVFANAKEREIVDTVGSLYLAQCGGNLIPPVSLKIIYEDLIEEKEKKE